MYLHIIAGILSIDVLSTYQVQSVQNVTHHLPFIKRKEQSPFPCVSSLGPCFSPLKLLSQKITDQVAYKQYKIFFTILDSGRARSWYQHGLWKALFQVHVAKGTRYLSGASFVRHWPHPWRLHPCDLSTSPRSHFLLPLSLGNWISIYEFWEETFRL